jgi:ABC-type multidrug transport system ATPase subunit
VTHAVDFLHLVDTIVLLKKGRIVMKGNYQDLKDSEYLKEVIGIHQSNQGTRVKKYEGDAVADSGSSPIDEMIESIDDVESQSDSSSLGSHSEDEKDEDEPTAINDETVRLFRKNKRNDKLMRSFSVGSISNHQTNQ